MQAECHPYSLRQACRISVLATSCCGRPRQKDDAAGEVLTYCQSDCAFRYAITLIMDPVVGVSGLVDAVAEVLVEDVLDEEVVEDVLLEVLSSSDSAR